MIGTYINYYFHCKRHLWLFAHNINMEHTSESVFIGKLISETTYQRQIHEIHLENEDNEIAIDFFEKKKKILHEVKKSNKMEELHIWQVKYYLYVIEAMGIEVKEAEIDYPKLKRKLNVKLNEKDRIEIKKVIGDIENIIKLNQIPSVIKKPYCKKCSYYDFCYC